MKKLLVLSLLALTTPTLAMDMPAEPAKTDAAAPAAAFKFTGETVTLKFTDGKAAVQVDGKDATAEQKAAIAQYVKDNHATMFSIGMSGIGMSF